MRRLRSGVGTSIARLLRRAFGFSMPESISKLDLRSQAGVIRGATISMERFLDQLRRSEWWIDWDEIRWFDS